MSEDDYAAKLAAFRKKKKIDFRKKTVAKVATVDTLHDNNSYDYYSTSCFLTEQLNSSRNCTWVADSGAGRHMTKRKIKPTKRASCRVTCANNEVLPVLGLVDMGDMKDVLVCPGLSHDLASIGQLCDDGAGVTEVIFDSTECRVVQDGEVVASGIRDGGLYIFPHTELEKFNSTGEPTRISTYLAFSVDPVTDFEKRQTLLWHERLGHLGFAGLIDIVANGSAMGIPADVTQAAAQLLLAENKCDGCTKGKSHRVPIRKHHHIKAKRRLELVHTDVMGPFPVNSRGGARYLVTFVDDYSGYVWVEFLERKSEVFDKIKQFVVKHSTSQCKVDGVVWGCDVQQLRSDNGGEYRNRRLTTFCKTMGITQQFSEPYTPEQNGKAERMNRTLLEMVKASLKHGHLEDPYWAHAFETAAYTRNRCLSSGTHKAKTPFELFYGKKPDRSL
jgi:transposase InsO family protein